MQSITKTKQIRLVAVAAALIIAVVLPSVALAQGVPTSNSGSALTEAGKILATPAIAIAGALVYVINLLLGWIITTLGLAVDALLAYNVTFVPAQWTFIQIGWSVLRDVVNSFFIIILLWIALTIIFNLERWGGRRLLIRLIVVGLLINFSLAFVTVIFSAANVFANSFSQSLPRACPTCPLAVSEFIASVVKLPSLATPATQATAPQRTPPVFFTYNNQPPSFSDTMLASVGVGDAHAQVGGIFTSLFNGIASAAGTAGNWLAGLAGTVLAPGVAIADKVIHWALLNVITMVLQGIIAALFIYITVMLLLRIIAISFLAILAPAAFAMYMMPGGFGEALWKKWWNQLLRWAFFAPVFYFLFYIALQMLNQVRLGTAPGTQALSIAGYGESLLLYLMTAGFLIAAAQISFKLAGSGATQMLGMAAKVGGVAAGVATGGVALAGLAAARMAPQATEAVARGARRIPLAGRSISQRVEQPLQDERKDVEKRRGELKNWSDKQLQDLQTSSIPGRGRDKAAALSILTERNKLDHIKGRETEALQLARRYGQEKGLLTRRPDLATSEFVSDSDKAKPVKSTVLKLRGDDMRNMDTNAVKGAGAQKEEVRNSIFINTNFSPSVAAGWAQRSQDGFEAVQELKKHFEGIQQNRQAYLSSLSSDQERAIFRQQEQVFERYFQGNLMQAGGNRRRGGGQQGGGTTQVSEVTAPQGEEKPGPTLYDAHGRPIKS